jgi:hypothetical protein
LAALEVAVAGEAENLQVVGAVVAPVENGDLVVNLERALGA